MSEQNQPQGDLALLHLPAIWGSTLHSLWFWNLRWSCSCGNGSPVQSGSLSGIKTVSSDCSICHYLPWSYLKSFWNEEGYKQEIYMSYTVVTFPQAALSLCVFFFSLIGSFIYVMQKIYHQNIFGVSLRCMSKSTSMFWPQVCLWAPCNFFTYDVSSKWLF